MAFITDNIESEGYITGSTISATTFFGNGVNLTNVATSTITGGTVSRTNNNSTLTFTNSTGGTFTVTPIVDTFVTGGTYNTGTGIITFLNNSGNTFTVTGLTSSDTFTTGFTYSNNLLTISRNQGLPSLTALINTMTGLTVNGSLSATTFNNATANINQLNATAGTITTLSSTTISATTFVGNGTSLTNVGLRIKSNSIAASGFTGNPKKAIVTFTTPFATTGYSISIIGGNNRAWSYESKTASGFTINANANGALSQPVLYTAIQNGEY